MKKISKQDLWMFEEEQALILNIDSNKFVAADIPIVYGPEISIANDDERSLFFIDKSNYDLNNIDELFKYLLDAEQAYGDSDDYYVWDGKSLNMEYDEDKYINYHFNNIPDKFLNDDSFAIRFFQKENEEEWDYGTNIFYCHNSVYFNVKSINTVIKIFKNIHHNYKSFFEIFTLNDIPLIDILNEYNDEKYFKVDSNDWVDEELFLNLFEKYKICKFKEMLEQKHPVKETKEKRTKI